MSYQSLDFNVPSKHWGKQTLNGWIYNDVFEDRFFEQLKSTSEHIIHKRNHSTYATHRTNFNFGGKNHKIVSHKQNDREQEVIFDLTFEKDWWYQTSDTIKSWADTQIMTTQSPILYKAIKTIEKYPPFCDEPNSWICYRWHMNFLAYNKFLALHLDANHQYYNVSVFDARMRSVTFYFDDHIEGNGGEFWTDTGFVYKPKRNSAININGGQVVHGVTTNMNPEPRLAFTLRFAHKDDLYLPGSPDKSIYKLEF